MLWQRNLRECVQRRQDLRRSEQLPLHERVCDQQHLLRTCYADKVKNPLNGYESCDVSKSTTSWTVTHQCVTTLAGSGTDGYKDGAALTALTDRALEADRQIDRLFWLGAIADHIRQQPGSRHTALLTFASRRIHAAFAVPYRDRQLAVRFISTRVIPLA